MMIEKANEMQKVEMVLFGKRALVDADMVKKMTKKQELVSSAQRLQSVMNAVPKEAEPILQKQLQEIMGKIIRLNRTIRKNVQFV
jgi:2,4-dienoyl-CoA reductase-like NADH-dependent reductase (Old Yellow Enzyme family)